MKLFLLAILLPTLTIGTVGVYANEGVQQHLNYEIMVQGIKAF